MASPSAAFALLGFCLIAAALAQSYGHYAVRSLSLTLVGAVLWSVGLMQSRAARSSDMLRVVRILAWATAALGVIVIWIVPPGQQAGLNRFNPYTLALINLVMLLIVGSYVPDLLHGRARSSSIARIRNLALFLCAAAMGGWMLYTEPAPKIDVFHMHQQGAERLIALEPVYGNLSVIDSHTKMRAIEDYVYPPLNLLLTTVPYPFTGDTRWASLVALLVSAFLIQRIARRRVGPKDVLPELLAAALLLHPRAAFVLGRAWGDPLALPFVAGFALYADKHKDTAAAVLLGLVCATKQYMLVFGASALLLPRLGVRGACVAGGVVAATLLPFAVWTPAELWEGLIVHHVENPFRRDSLTLSAFLVRQGLPALPGWVGFLAIPPVLLAALRLPRRLDVAVAAPAIALTWFFLFGRQAFANYYFFVSGVALVWAALCVGPAESDDGDGAQEPPARATPA